MLKLSKTYDWKTHWFSQFESITLLRSIHCLFGLWTITEEEFDAIESALTILEFDEYE